jgi:4-carboxymuconolactone decarboxylase
METHVKHIASSSRPLSPVDPNNFHLPADMQALLGRSDGLPVRIYRVVFAESARTHWHRHDDLQILLGVSGECSVVNRKGDSMVLGPGDVVVIAADEDHWHGAAHDSSGEHIAINLGQETTWLGPVD